MASDISDFVGRLDRLSNDVAVWADDLPYFDQGHYQCRARFDMELAANARLLAFELETLGLTIAARSFKEQFDRLADHASAMDVWCRANPAPIDPGEWYSQWSYEQAAGGVGDPEFTILYGCYDVIDEVKASLEAASTSQKPPVSKANPGSYIVDPDYRTEPMTAIEVVSRMGVVRCTNPAKWIKDAGIEHERVGRKYVIDLRKFPTQQRKS